MAKLMLRPGVAAPNLAPLIGQRDLARRGGVAYRDLLARSLLNRCDSPRMPFEWTVNPYRGCAIGCTYCYATYTHEFIGLSNPDGFHTSVYVKRGAEALTAQQLARVVRRGGRIALGTATDPYQPAEAQERVTRGFLEQVAQHRGVRIGITTKGALVLRDLDLLQRIHQRSSLSIHVSLVSPDPVLLRRLEPLAPAPEVRLTVLRRLAAAGLDVALALAPVLPGLTDGEEDLAELLARVAAAGVRRLSWGLLFLRSPTRQKYLRFVADTFPEYSRAYAQAYAGRVFLGGRYRARIGALIERLAAAHGLAPGDTERSSFSRLPRPPQQLRLWSS